MCTKVAEKVINVGDRSKCNGVKPGWAADKGVLYVKEVMLTA